MSGVHTAPPRDGGAAFGTRAEVHTAPPHSRGAIIKNTGACQMSGVHTAPPHDGGAAFDTIAGLNTTPLSLGGAAPPASGLQPLGRSSLDTHPLGGGVVYPIHPSGVDHVARSEDGEIRDCHALFDQTRTPPTSGRSPTSGSSSSSSATTGSSSSSVSGASRSPPASSAPATSPGSSSNTASSSSTGQTVSSTSSDESRRRASDYGSTPESSHSSSWLSHTSPARPGKGASGEAFFAGGDLEQEWVGRTVLSTDAVGTFLGQISEIRVEYMSPSTQIMAKARVAGW
jgi:hypothetical protein